MKWVTESEMKCQLIYYSKKRNFQTDISTLNQHVMQPEALAGQMRK